VVAQASLIAAALLVATAATADDKRYTLADLEALVSERAYQEAITHLADIAPAQRTAKWLEVAASAAAGLLATLDDTAKVFAVDAIDREYPQLAKSAKYAQARAEHGIVGLVACYRDRDFTECAKFGERLASGTDRKLVLEVARVTTKYGDAAVAAPLFKRVLDKSLCGDEQVRRAAIASIERIVPATDARAIIQTCWDGLKDAVVEAYDQAGKGSNVYKNTCDILEARKLLSPLQQKRCRAK
jgi:hypothetical protein